jgi:alpha-glucosidase
VPKRSELDGYAGAMTWLREAYDSMYQAASPPDALTEAMQSGDRLSYHPEHAQEEIKHFHDALPQAQAAVDAIGKDFPQRMEAFAKRMTTLRPADLEAEKQKRQSAMTRAQALIAQAAADTGK